MSLRAPRTARGFTLIELMVAITLLGVLLALAAPSFATWTRNSRVRTAAESVQDGLRLAQTEAVRRNRQVVFFLTDAEPSATANANVGGRNWTVRSLPLLTGEVGEFIRGGALSEGAGGTSVAITGAPAGTAVVCFNSTGRQVANTDPGVGGAQCVFNPVNPTKRFNVTMAGADRPLRVTVALSGQVRMCDPAKALSTTNPDGCP